MESILQSAVAGLIAALVATAILGSSKYTRQWLAKRRDVRYIRDLVTEDRGYVMGASDTFHKGMGATMSSGALRAAQYNNMLKKIGVALENWTMNLSHDQRKDLYDALDWYHTEGLHATEKDGTVVFMEPPAEGRWPTPEMSEEHARVRFEKLQSIRWLKLKAD